MEKDKNNLGVNFGEMMDSDFLIDTETGNIVTEKVFRDKKNKLNLKKR